MTDKRLENIEDILNKMLNDYEYGYAYTKSCMELLEQLTIYDDHIRATLVATND